MSAATHYKYGPTVCPTRVLHPGRGAARHALGCDTVAPHVGTANVKVCMACRAEMTDSVKAANRRVRGVNVTGRYRMRTPEIAALLRRQRYACAVCHTGLGRHNAHLDHDHRTGRARAFLCGHCNRALGHARDNPTVLRALAAYLEAHASTPPTIGLVAP